MIPEKSYMLRCVAKIVDQKASSFTAMMSLVVKLRAVQYQNVRLELEDVMNE